MQNSPVYFKAYDVLFGHGLRKLEEVQGKRITGGNASTMVEMRAFQNAYKCVAEAFMGNHDHFVKESDKSKARFEFGFEGDLTVEQARLVHKTFEEDPRRFIAMMDYFGVKAYKTSALHQLLAMHKIAKEFDSDFR